MIDWLFPHFNRLFPPVALNVVHIVNPFETMNISRNKSMIPNNADKIFNYECFTISALWMFQIILVGHTHSIPFVTDNYRRFRNLSILIQLSQRETMSTVCVRACVCVWSTWMNQHMESEAPRRACTQNKMQNYLTYQRIRLAFSNRLNRIMRNNEKKTVSHRRKHVIDSAINNYSFVICYQDELPL